MLILGLETATEMASVTLTREGREIAGWRTETAGDLCQHLAREAAGVLGRGGVSFQDLDLVAVGLGPGSFTSLRIGLATAKAFAIAHDTPLVGASSLAAMAWQERRRLGGLVCPVLDARRGDLYAGLYRVEGESIERVESEIVGKPEAVIGMLGARGREVTVFGQLSREQAEAFEAVGVRTEGETIYPSARAVAELGRARYEAEGGYDVAALRPIYLRKSYAEERFGIDLGLR
jgi:tRNA threonylcarbamoyladenosine biosynthesis protein TsaB